jgi:hypothetical protein
MEQFRARIGSLAKPAGPSGQAVVRLKAALAAIAATLALGGIFAGSAVAAPDQRTVAEAVVEVAEENEEAAEDRAAGSLAIAPQYAVHLERMKAKIAVIRASLKIDRLLPHNTTRWLYHLPKKRQHIKELRQRISVIRVLAAQAAG